MPKQLSPSLDVEQRLAAAMAERPNIEAEVTALRELCERFAMVRRKAGEALNSKALTDRISVAREGMTRAIALFDIGRGTKVEVEAAKAEYFEARDELDAAGGRRAVLLEEIEKIQDDISEAESKLSGALTPWRNAVETVQHEAEHQAVRLLYGAKLARHLCDVDWHPGEFVDFALTLADVETFAGGVLALRNRAPEYSPPQEIVDALRLFATANRALDYVPDSNSTTLAAAAADAGEKGILEARAAAFGKAL